MSKRNIAIEYRFAEGRPERLPTLAAELVELNFAPSLTVNMPLPGCEKCDEQDSDRLYVGRRSGVGGLVADFTRRKRRDRVHLCPRAQRQAVGAT